MTAGADAGTGTAAAEGEEPLDWLPEPAVLAGRALQPVLNAFGRDDSLSELSRQAAGFAADPPVVAITAVAAASSIESCSATQSIGRR